MTTEHIVVLYRGEHIWSDRAIHSVLSERALVE